VESVDECKIRLDKSEHRDDISFGINLSVFKYWFTSGYTPLNFCPLVLLSKTAFLFCKTLSSPKSSSSEAVSNSGFFFGMRKLEAPELLLWLFCLTCCSSSDSSSGERLLALLVFLPEPVGCLAAKRKFCVFICKIYIRLPYNFSFFLI